MRFCQFRSPRNLKEHKRKYFRTFHSIALSGSIILIVLIRQLREKVIRKIKTQSYSVSVPFCLYPPSPQNLTQSMVRFAINFRMKCENLLHREEIAV